MCPVETGEILWVSRYVVQFALDVELRGGIEGRGSHCSARPDRIVDDRGRILRIENNLTVDINRLVLQDPETDLLIETADIHRERELNFKGHGRNEVTGRADGRVGRELSRICNVEGCNGDRMV